MDAHNVPMSELNSGDVNTKHLYGDIKASVRNSESNKVFKDACFMENRKL